MAFTLIAFYVLTNHVKLAALKLIEQGKLSFETNAEDFLPELRNPVIVDTDSQGKSVVTPAKTAITVNHLLNHSSGLFYPFVPETPYALPALFVNKEVHRAQANSVSKFLQLLRVSIYRQTLVRGLLTRVITAGRLSWYTTQIRTWN